MTLIEERSTFEFTATGERGGVRVEVTISGPVDGEIREFVHAIAGDAIRQRRAARPELPASGRTVLPMKVIDERRLADGSVFRRLQVDGVDELGRPKSFEAIEGVGAVMFEGEVLVETHRYWTGTRPLKGADGTFVIPDAPALCRSLPMPSSPNYLPFESVAPWPTVPKVTVQAVPSPDEVDEEMRVALAARAQADPVERLRRDRERLQANAERERERLEHEQRYEARMKARQEAVRRAGQAVATVAWEEPGFTRPPAQRFEDPPADWAPPAPQEVRI